MELVHERDIAITDGTGRLYDCVRVHASPQVGGTWAGIIEFLPADGSEGVRSGRETTQSTPDAVAYWASGLEPGYGLTRRAHVQTCVRLEPAVPNVDLVLAGSRPDSFGATRSRRTTIDFDVGVRLPSATLSSGTSTLASGKYAAQLPGAVS